MTRNGFQLLMPLLVIMLSISVMNAVMLQTTGQIFPQLIGEALRPLIVASDTLTAVLISLFLCNLLWFVGIHGALIITGIMNPFWLTYLFENQRALAAGEAVLPHIYLQGSGILSVDWRYRLYAATGVYGNTKPLKAVEEWERLVFCLLCSTLMSQYCLASRHHEPGFYCPLFCSVDKCLYSPVFDANGYPRQGRCNAAMVNALTAGCCMVGQR